MYYIPISLILQYNAIQRVMEVFFKLYGKSREEMEVACVFLEQSSLLFSNFRHYFRHHGV